MDESAYVGCWLGAGRRELARQLAGRSSPGDPITSGDIEELISDRMLQEATPADVVRVSAHLAAGGWPLAKPEHFDPANWP